MHSEPMLIMGGKQFATQVISKVGLQPNVEVVHTKVDLDTPRTLNGELSILQQPIQQANTVFCSAQPFQLPLVEMALKNSKNVLLFETYLLDKEVLHQLLELALEARCYLVNGDALFFNPVVFPYIYYFQHAKFTKLKSNRSNQPITRRSLFYCLEMLLWKMKSPVKNIHAKGVRLGTKYLNMIHARIEFENDTVAQLEVSNIKEDNRLTVEAISDEAWLQLDLLSKTGSVQRLESDEELIRNIQPQHIIPIHTHPANNLFDYINNDLSKEVHKHAQFENTIEAAKILTQIEEQLKRSYSDFSYFQPE
ncbi:MAG: hypothetical protein KTR13_05715 [Saprospiraceae bacterium]|nr:hypothetical protein [Saprospiraceae bacterium]